MGSPVLPLKQQAGPDPRVGYSTQMRCEHMMSPFFLSATLKMNPLWLDLFTPPKILMKLRNLHQVRAQLMDRPAGDKQVESS